jgi:hypothetical protein
MKLGETVLLPRYRLECWKKVNTPNGGRYWIGLSADGVKQFPEGKCWVSETLISGTVLLDVYGRDFVVEKEIQHPSAMPPDEARIVLARIFEDMGRGAEYTDDELIWKPIEIDDFFASHFYSPTWQRLTRVLLRCVDPDLCQGKGRFN